MEWRPQPGEQHRNQLCPSDRQCRLLRHTWASPACMGYPMQNNNRHTCGQGQRVRRAVNDLLDGPDSRFPKRECAPALVRYWRQKKDDNHCSHSGQRRSIRIRRHAAYYYDKARHLDFRAQHYVELQERGGWGVFEQMPGPGKGGALRTFTLTDAYRYERTV